jgi:hypothetical protein
MDETMEGMNRLAFDAETNAVIEEKTIRFNEELIKKGFVFPAKGFWGNPSTRKAYEEGYFCLDSKNCPSVPRKTTPPTAASTAPPYSFTTAAISYTPAINCRTFPSPARTPVPITNKIPPIPYSSMICSIPSSSFYFA